jgi:hypothetical protein
VEIAVVSDLNYARLMVIGLSRGANDLFPVSGLGHSMLVPAVIGGSWSPRQRRKAVRPRRIWPSLSCCAWPPLARWSSFLVPTRHPVIRAAGLLTLPALPGHIGDAIRG